MCFGIGPSPAQQVVVPDKVSTQLGQTGTTSNAAAGFKRRSMLSGALSSGVDSTQAVIGNPQAKATLGA